MESSSARAVMLSIVPTSPVLTGEEGVSCFPSWQVWGKERFSSFEGRLSGKCLHFLITGKALPTTPDRICEGFDEPVSEGGQVGAGPAVCVAGTTVGFCVPWKL